MNMLTLRVFFAATIQQINELLLEKKSPDNCHLKANGSKKATPEVSIKKQCAIVQHKQNFLFFFCSTVFAMGTLFIVQYISTNQAKKNTIN